MKPLVLGMPEVEPQLRGDEASGPWDARGGTAVHIYASHTARGSHAVARCDSWLKNIGALRKE